MARTRIALRLAAALIVLGIGTYCGTSRSNRLMSITVTPNTATAMMNSISTVQFTAMGRFSNNMTRMLTAADGLMWMSSNSMMATVNNAGMAQCMTAGGPTTITATAPSINGSTMMMKGTAILSCM